MLKNIIFDWSGVIKDCVEAHVWVVSRMMESLGGKEISLQELKENWKQPYMSFWQKYYPELTFEQEKKLYLEIISREDYPKSEAYPGIVDFIKKNKAEGFSMVVLSSDPLDILLKEIKEFGLENVFSEVLADVHDKTEVLQKLMAKNNFNPAETIFIGDSNHEIEAGKLADVKTIAVTWGFTSEDRLEAESPDYLVHNIKELEKIFYDKR